MTIFFFFLSLSFSPVRFCFYRFGLSDSELEDVLSLDNTLISSLYPDRCPQVRRFPLSIWLYLKRKFAPILHTAFVYGHYVYCIHKQEMDAHILKMYDICVVQYHSTLAEYFRGIWAQKAKPLRDPRNPLVSFVCLFFLFCFA